MPDLIGAGAGLAGSILNYISNERANATNIQLQREANEANRQIAREQDQWNYYMWQQQNSYNDPSAQMSRLRAAGVNPALAYANGGLMNEAAPAQEAAGATMGAAQVRPYYNDPLMLAQVANLSAQTAKTKSEIPVNEATVEEINSRVRQIDAAAKKLGLESSLIEQTLPSQVAAAIAKNKFDNESAEAARKYVNETAKANYDALLVELENRRKDGLIKDETIERVKAEVRQKLAEAEVAEYEASNKDAAFWLGKIDSLWDVVAFMYLKYGQVLPEFTESAGRMFRGLIRKTGIEGH